MQVRRSVNLRRAIPHARFGRDLLRDVGVSCGGGVEEVEHEREVQWVGSEGQSFVRDAVSPDSSQQGTGFPWMPGNCRQARCNPVTAGRVTCPMAPGGATDTREGGEAQ